MDDEARAARVEAVLDELKGNLLQARKELLRLRPEYNEWPRWWRELTRCANRLEEEASHLTRIPAAQQLDMETGPARRRW